MSEAEQNENPQFSPEEARQFWKDARAKAQAGDCDFSGWFFPPDPDGKGFSDVKFIGPANFRGAKFDGDANFRRAKFDGYVSFDGAKFGGYAYFMIAEFGGEAIFFGAKFDGDANFGHAKFDGDANFFSSQFIKAAKFFGAKFNGHAIFFHTMFDRAVNFSDAKFNKRANFTDAEFRGDAKFSDTKFDGDVDFSGAKFCQKVEMDYAVSRGIFQIDLPSGWRRSNRHPFVQHGQGHDAYRMAKQSAADRGDYQLAGKYNYAEQSTRCTHKIISAWQESEWGKKTKGLISGVVEFIFGRLLFGYGERLRGILAVTALVILGCAICYCCGGIVSGATAEGERIMTGNFLDCLYFSTVTFTTLGYGDLKPIDGMRIFAASEAVLGAFLMALFVVAMARKFTR